MKRIAFLTSGGDAPGMNAALRAMVKTCLYNNYEPFGFFDGYQGLVENRHKRFYYKDVNNIISQGGTILGSSRSEEFRTPEGRRKAYENLINLGIEGIVIAGGDGSLSGAAQFEKEFNFPVIGIPASIDNDMYGTDFTIGFDTALNTVVESIDKIRDTANSHHRMFFVEVMGRHSGFLAIRAAIASGAEMVLLPELSSSIEELAKDLTEMNKGERGSIFVVAEGDELGGAERLSEKLCSFLRNFETRSIVLGHVQRGGRPSAVDRILATKLGTLAVESLLKQEKGIMIGSTATGINKTTLDKVIHKNHEIPKIDYEILKKMLTLSA